MQQTVESVREYGVLVPAIARPLEDGTYELISGHRRKHACELAGLTTMPVIVRNVDQNTATIIMVAIYLPIIFIYTGYGRYTIFNSIFCGFSIFNKLAFDFA